MPPIGKRPKNAEAILSKIVVAPARSFLLEKCGQQRLDDALRCINSPADYGAGMGVEGLPGPVDLFGDGTDGTGGRDGRDFSGYPEPLRDAMNFLADYVVLPESSVLVIAAWVIAAWLADVWDRFPHLAITSPEKRCGKTLLLELLFPIVPRPLYTTNISPAALYRAVQRDKPTLLMDESQSISRRGSEASEVIREILNAGIGKNARVIRCGGANHDEIHEFSVYSPKVFALIGDLDGVLSDRCLPVPMKRKTKEHKVERYRSRKVEADGKVLHDKLEQWAAANGEKIAEVYDTVQSFNIDNDRMADLLTPLQAVLTVLGGEEPLDILQKYACGLDERDREQETQSPGVRLLVACREMTSTRSRLCLGKKGSWRQIC